MKELLSDYWNVIAKKPSYWIPLMIFSAVGYGFSICNRTIHVDDFYKDYYNSVFPFSGRWGMLVWAKLIGVTDLLPFVDRFVALLFLLASSFFIGALFFQLKNKSGDVSSFTVLSSMLLTYPLVNEIFEYTNADFQYTGNLALMLYAFTYLTLKREKLTLRVVLYASVIMILPASSYEVGIFSYITILCAVILYKHLQTKGMHISFTEWLYENVYYLTPLLLAVVFRFVVHYAILLVCDASYIQVGGSNVDYSNTTFSYIIGSHLFKYYVAGLVYFPITVFVLFSLFFTGYILQKSISYHNSRIFVLAMLFYLSLFSLVVRGVCMDYRIAQTITVFVAFSSFLICELKIRWYKFRLLIPVFLLFLCWHQAVYINKLLSLNNMRSNNEIESLRYIGNRIMSEYGGNKPVVFIAEQDGYGGYLGPWINQRLYADVDTWNGKLFIKLVRNYLPEKYHHYKFVNSNVNNVLNWLDADNLKTFFSYCGYDIDVMSFSSILASESNLVVRRHLEKQYEIANATMNPMEIRDVGNCLLVKYYK